MSDSREQSYYEIALTNRQVMGVFVVLLVCVLAAFLGGVWVGRSGSPTVATVEPEAISSGRGFGEEPLQELDFFEREGAGPADEKPATVAEGDSTAPPPAEQPIIIEEIGRRRATEPATATTDGDGDIPFPLETQSTTPAERPTAPTARQAGADPTSTLEGDVVIQVFSSREEAQAQRVLDRLRAGGYPAAMSPVDVDGSPMYRVRVGPYSERTKAQEVADVIRRSYKLDTWITR